LECSRLPSKFDELIAHYTPKIALQFSGGRDSLALLFLLREYWPKLTVYYLNSGDAYPETLALVKKLRQEIPSFVEIAGRTAMTHARDGFPADVIPSQVSWGFDTYKEKLKIIGRETCCYKSIMLPLQAQMRADGIKLILRGQRNSDEPKSPLKSGDIVDGVMVYFPIEAWTTAEVNHYIRRVGGEVPHYYAEGMTSAPDCMHCSAWLETGSFEYLRKYHPLEAQVVRERIQWIVSKTEDAQTRMKNIGASRG
jgi:3'-phosphoadenosine 5'-phosphosulfate sulfotransferase (PAPS reductase)/FAD synthetase